MEFYLLASGSKGNCFVLKDYDTKIMIDCGTTKTYLTHSFHNLDLKYNSIDAVLVTHDHSDHTKQIKMFSKHLIYSPTQLKDINCQLVNPYQSFMINHLQITPIALSHDAELNVGYIIETADEKLVYVTDTGYFSKQNMSYIVGADYYIFESNHDPSLLMKTSRPFSIKQRILSATGHLSNDEASDILASVIDAKCKQVILAHISEEANDYDLAQQTLKNKLNGFKVDIKVARQFEIIKGGNNV